MTSLAKILIIDDNSKLMEDALPMYGYEVKTANDGLMGLKILDEDNNFDLILLDELENKINDYSSRPVPIFLLGKNGVEYDITNAEVLSKPLSLSNLIDAIKSGINVFENSEEGYLRFNHYELRPLTKEILNERNNEITKLTEKEVSIIKYLYKSGAKIVSKNELLQEVWGYSPEVTTHTIETHIYRLRQKVEHEDTSAQLILTSDGGYKLKL